MILANHLGEDALLAALAGGGTSAVGGVLLLARTKLDGLLRRLRPRGGRRTRASLVRWQHRR